MEARQRDEFEQFVASHGVALLRTAYLLTGDRREAEDVLQSALERVSMAWGRDEVVDPSAYTRKAVVNAAMDRWRRLRRRVATVTLTKDAPSADDHVTTIVTRDALLSVLRSLPPAQTAVVVLRYWEGYSEAETAELLGCSIASVKNRSRRALLRLREIYSDTEALAVTVPESRGEH